MFERMVQVRPWHQGGTLCAKNLHLEQGITCHYWCEVGLNIPSLEGSTRGQRDLRTLATLPVLPRRGTSGNTQTTHPTLLLDTPQPGEGLVGGIMLQEHYRFAEVLCNR